MRHSGWAGIKTHQQGSSRRVVRPGQDAEEQPAIKPEAQTFGQLRVVTGIALEAAPNGDSRVRDQGVVW